MMNVLTVISKVACLALFGFVEKIEEFLNEVRAYF
jgi:hypothetical protein